MRQLPDLGERLTRAAQNKSNVRLVFENGETLSGSIVLIRLPDTGGVNQLVVEVDHQTLDVDPWQIAYVDEVEDG